MNLRNFLKNHFVVCEYVVICDYKNDSIHDYSYEEIFSNSFFTDFVLDNETHFDILIDGLHCPYLRIVL